MSIRQGGQERLPYLALATVCILWGTTYLGIRVALEGLPPLYLIAIRYTISGTILLVVAGLSGAQIPRGRELLQTAICGTICIGIGNGLLAIAETYIPSGLAALIYCTCPFWMIGIDALLPQGKRPQIATVGGLLVGLMGVAYLVYPEAVRYGLGGRVIAGFLLLQICGAGWVLGSLLQKRVKARSHIFVSGAVQQLAAGLAMFIPAGIWEHMPHSVGRGPVLAVAYLVVFGSLIGFSSFVYSVAKLPVAIVSIYTFVNPVVAVFLGWYFYHEPFGSRELIAMAIIFTGIGLVRWSESAKASVTRVALET